MQIVLISECQFMKLPFTHSLPERAGVKLNKKSPLVKTRRLQYFGQKLLYSFARNSILNRIVRDNLGSE